MSIPLLDLKLVTSSLLSASRLPWIGCMLPWLVNSELTYVTAGVERNISRFVQPCSSSFVPMLLPSAW
eukprot:2412969-Amphidinium_carterae.1